MYPRISNIDNNLPLILVYSKPFLTNFHLPFQKYNNYKNTEQQYYKYLFSYDHASGGSSSSGTCRFGASQLGFTYTPPTGTTLVIYECQFTLRSSDSNAILGGHLKIDSDTILESRFGLRGGTNYSDMLYHFKFGINIGGSASATTGRVASWTSGKTLKLELDEHGSSYEWVANILGNYGNAGHQSAVRRPQIGITAIGTLS